MELKHLAGVLLPLSVDRQGGLNLLLYIRPDERVPLSIARRTLSLRRIPGWSRPSEMVSADRDAGLPYIVHAAKAR